MKRFLICILLLIASASTLALDLYYDETVIPKQYEYLDAPSKYSYYFVSKYCKNWSLAFSEITRSGMKDLTSAIGMGELKRLKLRADRKGIGQHLDILLNSHGYYFGLNACFGDNTTRKNAFTANLIAADSLGTLSGTSMGVLTWIGGVKLIQAGAKYIKIPARWLKRAKVAVYASIGIGTGAYITTNIIRDIQEKLEIIEQLENDSFQKEVEINELEQDLLEVEAMLDDPDLTQEQRDIVVEYISQVRDRIFSLRADIITNEKYTKELK